MVWLIVLLSLGVLLVVFLARPRPAGNDDLIGPAQTAEEIERSTAPGAASGPAS